MLTKIGLTNVNLQLKEIPLETYSNEKNTHFWITFRLKSSYCQTEKIFMSQQPSDPGHLTLHFQQTNHLFFEDEGETIEIKIFKKNQEGIQPLINLTQSIRSFLRGQKIVLDKLSKEIETLNYNLAVQKIAEVKFVQLKNILIELMPLVGKNKEMVLEIETAKSKYRVLKSHKTLFWNESVKIYVEGQESIHFSLIDIQEENTYLLELQLGLLQHESGFRKNLIKNELHFPIGCIQFEYMTQGLFTLKQKLKTVETKQLYKIQMNKVKGILKEQHSEMSMKIISDLNYFESQKTPENQMSNVFEFEINNYIYTAEPKCNFTIFGKKNGENVVGNAIINLHMLGKYDRKVVFHELGTHHQMGHLIVSITCLKVETKALRLKNICLKFDEDSKGEGEEFFIKANVGGTFGKTQQKPFQRIISFTSNLQVRYSTEISVQMEIVSSKCRLPIFVNLNIQQLETVIKNIIQKPFGDEQSHIKGRTNLQFEYFPKIERDEKEEEKKKSQIDPSSYQDHLQWCERQKVMAHKNIEVSQKIINLHEQQSPQFQKSSEKMPIRDIKQKVQIRKTYPNRVEQNNLMKKPSIHTAMKSHVLNYSKKSTSKGKKNEQKEEMSPRRGDTKTSEGTQRFQKIVDIYLGDRQQLTSRKHSIHSSQKNPPSSHRSSSHSNKKKTQDKSAIPELPNIKPKGTSSGSRKYPSNMENESTNSKEVLISTQDSPMIGTISNDM